MIVSAVYAGRRAATWERLKLPPRDPGPADGLELLYLLFDGAEIITVESYRQFSKMFA